MHITVEDYIKYWRGRKDKTCLSMSNLHFGHWKAVAPKKYLASIHTQTIELTFRTGAPLKRWTYGLSVML